MSYRNVSYKSGSYQDLTKCNPKQKIIGKFLGGY